MVGAHLMMQVQLGHHSFEKQDCFELEIWGREEQLVFEEVVQSVLNARYLDEKVGCLPWLLDRQSSLLYLDAYR